MKNEIENCLECNKKLEGRADQKFCNHYCKSSYHYQQNKLQRHSIYVKIDAQLKRNRIILKKFNKGGKSTLRKEKLLAAGFNPNYFTHYWKNAQGKVYLFCYEYGFLAFSDLSGTPKYTLIIWQDYMTK
ncbi:MAG: hypothetical protein ACI9C9_002393 [Marivirga sp.]|jgi:hypothetical protein